MLYGEAVHHSGGRPHPGQVRADRLPMDRDGAARRLDAAGAVPRPERVGGRHREVEGVLGAEGGTADAVSLVALIPLIPALIWALSAAAAWCL